MLIYYLLPEIVPQNPLTDYVVSDIVTLLAKANNVYRITDHSKESIQMATRQKAYKAYKGLPMEGFIAKWYAKNTKTDSRGFKTTAKVVVAQVPSGGSILEVAPGPGYLAIEMAKLGDYRVTGLDISQSFVRIASENAREAGVS